ncbi:ataxin-2 homolog [Telopea speciosissima]|uniref:ataxin-2 homolog n=1 Tax=Telopea speciosissima TaxID=54955 RepID=UPI001CC621E7|nr:ataxin-2 homolog [Telopea speciosissima]
MASGSSGRVGSGGSKGFDFGSDDILCSYDDLGNQEAPIGNHRDPSMNRNSGKEGKTGRSSLLNAYNHQEESLNQDLISTVENTMKKYADNLLRFLEGISSRLSQLELYCYNLDKSVGEMRSDLVGKHSEADSKLRSLEKHLQEVHRYVQILRDKQELAETQKELVKLQLVQKESSSSIHLQHKEERGAPSGSDSQKVVCTAQGQNLQLALALPHQVSVSSSLPPRPVEQQQPLAAPQQTLPQNVHAQVQTLSYYTPQNHLPNLLLQSQHQPQDQYLQADTQYQRPQMHDLSRQAPQSLVSQTTQTQQMLPFSAYPQQWPPQFPRDVHQPQQPSPQPQVRPQTTTVYSSYLSTQPANPPPETFSGSMPMQVSFSGVLPPVVSRAESMAYGYNGAVRTTTVQQSLSPQHSIQRQPQPSTNQSTFGVHLNDGSFSGAGSHPSQPQGQGYMIYDGEGGLTSHPPPPHYPQGGYPQTTTHTSVQNLQPTAGGSLLVRHPSPSQMMRSHMNSELIEKAVSMNYGRENVAAVIRRLEESGQPVDFNSLIHMLNVQSSGGSQRGWSG